MRPTLPCIRSKLTRSRFGHVSTRDTAIRAASHPGIAVARRQQRVKNTVGGFRQLWRVVIKENEAG
jgi:hypothetical protein